MTKKMSIQVCAEELVGEHKRGEAFFLERFFTPAAQRMRSPKKTRDALPLTAEGTTAFLQGASLLVTISLFLVGGTPDQQPVFNMVQPICGLATT
jgi:hypothetical protein